MNPLLDLLERTERGRLLADTPSHRRALALLAWDRVVQQVAVACRSRAAAELVRARIPFVHPDPIRLHQELADELRPEGRANVWPPLTEISDVLDRLDGPRPLRLEGADLVRIAAAAADLDALRRHFLDRAETCPQWYAGARALAPLAALSAAVERALDRDGSVRDDATPELRRLRREARDTERRARDLVTRLMQDARERGWTTGAEVTLRGDRFCLPMRAGDKRKLDGIVHDRSSTGGTLYIEPAGAVQLQNDLTEARLAAGAEETRILLELNATVERHADDLRTAGRFGLQVDAARAALLWSERVRGNRIAVGEDEPLELHAARHPLLLAQAPDAVVPLDLALAEGARVLLISGPNAGGKSVALKCVGLMTLLAQCGWDVPAGQASRLPLARTLCVDLGDDQSITRSLSSFSAHLAHLSGFLAVADPATLVLCDEIGSGTDPEEGAALAFTVLEALADRGARVLATTHYGLLKAAVDDHPLMDNAAMDFDETDLRPLYTLRYGVPGASHAFDIAGRMGLPADVLRRARARVGEERFQVERLLAELGSRTREAREARDAAVVDARAAARRLAELEQRLAGLDGERDRLLAETRRDGERYLAEARREMEAVVRELRSDRAAGETIRQGRDTLDRLADALPPLRTTAPAPLPAVGCRVRIPHLGLTGRVVEVRGDKLRVQAGGLRLNLSPADVDSLPAGDQEAPPQARERVSLAAWHPADEAPAAHEIDLRGYRADEGWEALDRLIDRALPAGLHEVSVIHGFGTGRLRAFLLERLKADSRVAACHEASPDSGGGGRTIVRLAGGS